MDATRYDAFWLWAGVKPQPALAHARRIYLLQGAVVGGDAPRMIAQRPAVPRVRHAELWMVLRVETLAWPPQIDAQLRAALDRWQRAGNRIAGIQIDFDARTRHLSRYAAFLKSLRAKLPPRYRLSITGLLDWSANGDPEGLAQLSGVVDEVVVQIYQGRHVIPGYQGYVAKLGRWPIPFRIGLLQGGEWTPPPGLTANPRFRGYVVFLLNP
ncbi:MULTISPECIES: DUF3142 domain-containing protein [Sphingomonas]|uniref:DUF3142 domain-containing protein n=1 Tax=Sphingomonas trueperi TaxID=53317 RepID=A0A7X5Y257_9SPHN|nr:DUF3142 domain-containing protein [Sphingomonas sp. ABOLD]NJB98390.1 hypothetical protein [Sphingomonas trueperi]